MVTIIFRFNTVAKTYMTLANIFRFITVAKTYMTLANIVMILQKVYLCYKKIYRYIDLFCSFFYYICICNDKNGLYSYNPPPSEELIFLWDPYQI